MPSDIYLDTSTVVAATIAGSTNSRANARFCDRLVSQQSSIYFSQLMRLEYSEAFKKLATKPGELPAELRRQYQLDDWGTNLLVRRRWMDFGVAQLDQFVNRFAEIFELPLNRTTWLRSVAVMVENQLRSYDAVHVATAREAHLLHFATTDRHFRKIDDLTIWLTLDSADDNTES